MGRGEKRMKERKRDARDQLRAEPKLAATSMLWLCCGHLYIAVCKEETNNKVIHSLQSRALPHLHVRTQRDRHTETDRETDIDRET